MRESSKTKRERGEKKRNRLKDTSGETDEKEKKKQPFHAKIVCKAPLPKDLSSEKVRRFV
jgi:hypothetical protein